jgi:hypothetical protein
MATNKAESLSTKQQKALAALVAQPTLPLAAAQAGVGHRTLCRWLAEDEAFKAEFRRIKQEIVGNAVYQLQKATNNAANALISLMNDLETPASVRLAAAKAILEMAIEAVKVEDLAARLEVLEQAQHLNGNGRGIKTW